MKLNSLTEEERKEKEPDNCSQIKKTEFSESMILNEIMNNSQDTIYFKDKNSKFLLNSKAHSLQFGIDRSKDLIGKSDFDFFPETFAQNAFEIEKRIMQTGEPIIGEVEKWVKQDGSIVWFSASKYPFYDQDGNAIGTWGTSHDITQLKMAEEELARLNDKLEQANAQLKKISDIDGLSGLYNHRRFYENLRRAIDIYTAEEKEGFDKSFCTVLLDIDCFKSVNDTYGHLFGDMAIKHIADIITANTRLTDNCFRYGGDEFAIILHDTDIVTGKEFCQRLCKTMEASSLVVKDVKIKLTVSIGIASFDGKISCSEMIQQADNRLYESKRKGKNQVN